MSAYEIFYIATNPIFIFSVYKLFGAFFKEYIYSRKVQLFLYFFYFISSSILVFITRIPIIIFIFTLIFLFLISLNYNSSFQKKIIFVSLIYSILLVIEILISIAIGFLDISMHTSSLFNSVVGLVLVRTITVVISCFISRYIKSIKSNFSVPKIYYLAFSVILFGTLYLFFSSLGNNSISLYNVAIGGLILIIVNITMIVVDEKIYESILARREKDMLIQQNIAYENQASIINQSSETIRSLNHDMKNHLIILNKLYLDKRKDEIEEYIDKVISQMDDISLSKSNNFVIDSIINFKLQKILNKNVDIKLDIKIPEIINILAFDITIILGNLLDNAITAIEQSSNKMLDLRISYNLGNLIIFIDNSFDGNLIVKKDKLKTTKSAYTNHGMGIDNVEKSLKNYGGEIRIKHTDKIFSVSVIIPYKN